MRDIYEEISKFAEREKEETEKAVQEEENQVCIKADSYIAKEIKYQTALLHQILDGVNKLLLPEKKGKELHFNQAISISNPRELSADEIGRLVRGEKERMFYHQEAGAGEGGNIAMKGLKISIDEAHSEGMGKREKVEIKELRLHAKEITAECEKRGYLFKDAELLVEVLKDEIHKCKEAVEEKSFKAGRGVRHQMKRVHILRWERLTQGIYKASDSPSRRGKGKNMRENLKKARREAGMTQQQMADRLEIECRYYKAIESGERLGGIWMWDRLEDITGVHQRVLRENHPGKEDSP